MIELSLPQKVLFRRSPALQLTVLASVGAAVGIFTVAALSLERWPLILAAGLFPFAAIITRRFRELLLAVIIFDIPLGLDIHLGAREDAASMGALSGLNVSATSICLFLLYLSWIAGFARRRGPIPLARIHDSLPLILYIGALVLSLLVATDQFLAVSQIWLYAQMLLLYIYVISTTETRRQLTFIITMLVAVLLFESLVIICVWLTGQDITLGPISTVVHGDYGSRVGGNFGSPNAAAAYLSMMLAVAASLFFTPLQKFHKWLAAFAVGFGGIALVSTGSRGGWISLGIGLLVVSILAWRHGRWSFKVFIPAIALTALLALVGHQAITARVLDDDGGAAYSRIPLMKLAVRMIAENPLLGVGANNFAAVLNEFVAPEFEGEWLSTVHNEFLKVWSETGIIGLVAFVVFLVATLRSAWACTRSRDPLIGALGYGLTAAVLARTLHMTVELLVSRPSVQLLFFLAGLIKAIELLRRRVARSWSAPKVAAAQAKLAASLAGR